ncbi:hypothetical protein J8I26_04275 [Herbaspirillum sp. LeCh32-8]|uniref:hypothetical protein n=1 Tax=Herbaspirillum sp. LeCh32-8 TaxID=2821356 RepID=UPI001AE6447C|nr:hypothetical protein [Herbaspirillum sp. LeCh32-8]MBP0597307.1 hypothetical protein [Herbaspirillum sp. LeCh32-8]
MARPTDITELSDAACRLAAGGNRPRGPAQRRAELQAAAQPERYGPESEVPLGDAAPGHDAEPEIESARAHAPVPIGNGEVVVETIIGSGDRAHHLALAPATGQATLRSPRPVRPRATPGAPAPDEPLVAKPQAASRFDKRRRFGADACCDPACALGCGALHCSRAGVETL